MSLPQSLEGVSCAELAARWQIEPVLALKLIHVNAEWMRRLPGLGALRIISGWRSAEEQRGLELEGRPAAPDELSTHRSCPATGADISLPIAADDSAKLEFGRLATLLGLRWGGGGPIDARGIPVDWPHVDLGPRSRA